MVIPKALAISASKHVLRSGHLNLQIVIAGPERPDLLVPALHRLLADLGSIGAGNATVFFRALQVLFPSIAILDAPPRSLLDGTPEFILGDLDKPRPADSGRDRSRKAYPPGFGDEVCTSP